MPGEETSGGASVLAEAAGQAESVTKGGAETEPQGGDAGSVEQAETQFFEEHFKGKRGETKPKPEKAAPAAKPKEEAEPEEETPDDTGEADEGGTTTDGGLTADELQDIIPVLRRDNWTQKAIEALAKSDPDSLKEIAAAALKRQTDIDQKINGKKPKQDPDEAGEEAEETPTGAPSDKALEELVTSLADELGSDEAVPVLTKLAAHVQAATIEALKPELAELRGFVGELRAVHGQAVLQAERTRLGERFPQLNEDAGFDQWKGRIKTLFEKGFQGSDAEVAEIAAKIEFGELNMRQAQKEMFDRQTRAARSQPTAPRKTPKKPPASDEDREFAAFKAIKSGKGMAGAQAAMAGMD